MSLVKASILGFVAGFVAVLIFHQGLWYLFELAGFHPFTRAAWDLDPIPPFGVPSLLSKAFWGGVWAAVLAPLFRNLRGSAYWASWIIVASVVPTLAAFFVVPLIKGFPLPLLWPGLPAGLVINAFWGFGIALLLRLMTRA